MKRFFLTTCLAISVLFSLATKVSAEGGIYASGGGAKTVGQTFNITVAASGADFDSLQGTISVDGPVDVVSFSTGSATWLPGKAPGNGNQFVGIISATSSATVSVIKLKAKSVGSGSVSVGGVKLARNGVVTGTGAGGANFNIERAPEPPGSVSVTSSSHPDQNQSYEATNVVLAWERPAKATGFAYVFDQAEKTTPPSKVTSNETTVTYSDQAIGTYYFHIKAHNNDGWSGVTHFKVTIKEPDAKILETLPKPSKLTVIKGSKFENNIKDGTVTGLIISGVTEIGYDANIKLDPAPTIPEGKTLTTTADSEGNFALFVDFPIRAGRYTLTVQGQKEKTLTPLSDSINFEISQAKGGTITILSDEDTLPPKPILPPPLKWYEKMGGVNRIVTIAGALILSLVTLNIFTVFKLRRRRR
ncbi:MAG TPA: fibronectin type III domain-containing protein [bacterium]|nr:fibronectin type III domain-containing protein [bacterium]